MLYMIYSLLISAAAFMLASFMLPCFHVTSFLWALVAAAVLGICNAIVRPIVILFTLPLTVLTLGLFLLVVNGLVLLFAINFVPGVHVMGLGCAILGAVIISLINAVLGSILG
jgi:putative membrane protein